MGRSSGQGFSPRTAEVVDRVRCLATPILADRGLDLVEIEFRREGRGWVLRLYMDREGGVTLEDCQRVSEELSYHLDVGDLVQHPYTLEVSSPGLDRPLTREADFLTFLGRAARVTTGEPLEGRRNFRGRLAGLENDAVILDLAEGRRVKIPRKAIAKARLEIEL